MTARDWMYVGFLCIACGFVGYGLKKEVKPVEPVHTKRQLVCFDTGGNAKLQLVEYNIRFEGAVIRFTNGDGEYAIYPPSGWMCSNVAKR